MRHFTAASCCEHCAATTHCERCVATIRFDAATTHCERCVATTHYDTAQLLRAVTQLPRKLIGHGHVRVRMHWVEQRVLPAVAAGVSDRLLLAPGAESAVWCGPAPSATAAADSAQPSQSTHNTWPASQHTTRPPIQHTTHGQPVNTPHTVISLWMKQLMCVYLQFGLF